MSAMRSRAVHSIAVMLSCCHYGSCGWTLSTTKPALFMRGGGGDNEHFIATSEVVGAAGRMGSLWLRQEGSVAVPRGVSPGCRSRPGNPIYVATPSKSWRRIHQETLESRRDDLVWTGNGLLLPEFMDSTVVVPHYGILSVGEKLSALPSSQPTSVYGKHGERVAEILQREGIQTELVTSWNRIQIRAARKLLWASCMWLLCHSSDPPLMVEQVHEQNQAVLQELVKELLPALDAIMGTNIDFNETLSYLEAYSRSMTDVTPSKALAIDEVKERNGVWLELRSRHPQPFHEELLLRVAGSDILEQAKAEPLAQRSDDRQSVHLQEVGLTVWGSRVSRSPCKCAIVIGGGIVGSSVALNLARRGMNVTGFDRLHENELGATTPASWAWINANNKSPLGYQWLNQLGIHSWRRDPVVFDLPSWNGALVQYKETPLSLGGYSIEGPLSMQKVHELEPQSNFSYSDGPVYFFKEEGYVDPAAAVHSMRQAAKDLGVQFRSGQNVTILIRNAEGCVTGVQSYSLFSSSSDTVSTLADIVVVAAGIGSAASALGGLPLTYSPGQIAFARTKESSPSRLTRILVDTVKESHVLQREDGTIVAGGGFLEVGGTPSFSKELRQIVDRGSELLSVAAKLSPGPVGSSELMHTAKAVRPMPKDGWPAVGFLGPGLYTVRACGVMGNKIRQLSLSTVSFTYCFFFTSLLKRL